MTGPGRLRVGVLLGERPDLLRALLAVEAAEVVAVARDVAAGADPLAYELPAALVRRWPGRGPGARELREAQTAAWFAELRVELVVAAGWLWLLGPSFRHAFGERIINVHPTLLPAFPGRHSVERAVASGVRVHGVTVHRVDAGVDTGPIIAQAALAVDDGAGAAEVRRRLAPLEQRLLADVTRAIALGEDAPRRPA